MTSFPQSEKLKIPICHLRQLQIIITIVEYQNSRCYQSFYYIYHDMYQSKIVLIRMVLPIFLFKKYLYFHGEWHYGVILINKMDYNYNKYLCILIRNTDQ